MAPVGKAPSVAEAIEQVREEIFASHTVSEFVALVWANMQDERYGSAWAKLWVLFMGMPAERRAIDITARAEYGASDVLAARHAQQIAEGKLGGGVLIEGEVMELKEEGEKDGG